MKKLIFSVALLSAALSASAEEHPLWMRYPAISPDGTTIAFAYKGDLYSVSVNGGEARQLTTHAAFDSHPVWSPDSKKIAFNPAVELSYLTQKEQGKLVDTMESEQATPSLSQAQRLKKFSQEGKLTEESMLAIMSEEKKPEIGRVTLGTDTLRKYFPTNWTPKQMEDQILKLLNNWYQRTHSSPAR